MDEYAVKGNRSEHVQGEAHRNTLLKEGYDIIDKEGNVIEKSPSAKVSYTEYAEMKTEYQKLSDAYKDIESKLVDLNTRTEAKVRLENKVLTEKVAELEEKLKNSGGLLGGL